MTFSHDQDRHRYEEAVLAALDFEPALDPSRPAAHRRPRRRPRRRAIRLAALVLAHLFFAVAFAAALAAGRTGVPLVVAALAWLGGTVLIVRAALRAGRARLLDRPPF